MVYPRFTAASFWDYQAACELVGARSPSPPLGLITVAALLPNSWEVRLINRNTENLGDADLEWADLVMTGGMLPQQPDTFRLIEMCRARGKPVVVGGPDVTSSPSLYAAANFLVLGEAEPVIDQFIAAWRHGERQGTFESPMGQTDVTKSPTPRFDLLKLDQYLHVAVQFSRGCPFNCEFCDIIELYGRVPRSKTNEQILTELDALYRLGYRGHIVFADDNLIGNKKALKRLLPDVQQWLREKHYPFEFSTEASINLSDDRELMAAMVAANFFAVFVGIESPDAETLAMMRKKQNTRRSLAESINRIYDAGMFVFAGFIIGFDQETSSAVELMIECIEATAIPVCMVGLLYALPTTQLGRRLLREGRLFPEAGIAKPEFGDQCATGLNFLTMRPRREVLSDYRAVLDAIYDPEAFFGRLERMARRLRRPKRRCRVSLRIVLRDARALVRLVLRLCATASTRRPFGRAVLDCALYNLRAMPFVVMNSALYLHLGPYARLVIEQIDRQIAEIDQGRWVAPEPLRGDTEVLSVA